MTEPKSRVIVRVPVGGEHDRWSESGARSLIGQQIAVTLHGVEVGQGTVVAAELVDDGRAVMVTAEHGGDVLPAAGPVRASFLASVADLDDPPRPFTEHPPTVQVCRPPDTD